MDQIWAGYRFSLINEMILSIPVIIFLMSVVIKAIHINIRLLHLMLEIILTQWYVVVFFSFFFLGGEGISHNTLLFDSPVRPRVSKKLM